MKKFLTLLATLMTLAFVGCAADATSPEPTAGDPAVAPPAATTADTKTVRRFELHKNGPATFKDYEVPAAIVDRAAALVSDPSLPHTMSAIALDPCQYIQTYFGPWPDKWNTDLIVWHDVQTNPPGYITGFSGMMACIVGTGTLDLTTAYYASVWPCFSAPNPAACLANIRVSGNVRAVLNENVGTSLCYFEDNSGAYFFSTYPSTSWGPWMAANATYAVNSTSVTCF